MVIPTSHMDNAGLGKRDLFIHRVLNRMYERRDIGIDGDLYLRRWYIRGVGTDHQIFLHHIVRPDKGRELHDHPFPFKTRILSGGYYEQFISPAAQTGVVTTDGQWCVGGYTFEHPATYTHRIDKVLDGTYTLVSAGAAERVWGFLTSVRDSAWTCKLGWLPWREYLGTPDAPDFPEDVIR